MITKFKIFEEFDMAATLDVYNQKRRDLTLSSRSKLKKTIELNPYRVYWEFGEKDQKDRFRNLLEIGVKSGDSVLDYGCGLGDLYRFSKSIGLNIHYTGVDINRGYIKDAIYQYEVRLKHMFPFIMKKTETPKFYSIKSIDDVKGKFDWILASGVFTYSFTVDGIIEFLIKAYDKCNKGIGFNILPSNWSDDVSTSYMGKSYMIKYNPKHLLNKIKEHFPNAEYVEKIVSHGSYDGIYYIKK